MHVNVNVNREVVDFTCWSRTRSGLNFEVLATSKSKSRAKTTSRNDLFTFNHGFCTPTPEWWILLPGAMNARFGSIMLHHGTRQ